MGKVSHFLGIEFTWFTSPDDHVCVNLTQQSFSENLIESVGYDSLSTSPYTSLYHSDLPIDSIPSSESNVLDNDPLQLKYQLLVSSLNWLAHIDF